MRSGVWFGLALGLAGCSGGYPLEPTPCDELCHVSRGLSCPDDYDPAGCVATCESGNMDAVECRQPFDATVACYRRSPDAVAQQCDFYLPYMTRPCELEREALALCVSSVSASSYGP
jgi:hypothetical protein